LNAGAGLGCSLVVAGVGCSESQLALLGPECAALVSSRWFQCHADAGMPGRRPQAYSSNPTFGVEVGMDEAASATTALKLASL
jgi:hypothetical protein